MIGIATAAAEVIYVGKTSERHWDHQAFGETGTRLGAGWGGG